MILNLLQNTNKTKKKTLMLYNDRSNHCVFNVYYTTKEMKCSCIYIYKVRTPNIKNNCFQTFCLTYFYTITHVKFKFSCIIWMHAFLYLSISNGFPRLYSNLFKFNFGRNFGRFLQRACVAERWTCAVFTVYCVQPTESVRGPQ